MGRSHPMFKPAAPGAPAIASGLRWRWKRGTVRPAWGPWSWASRAALGAGGRNGTW